MSLTFLPFCPLIFTNNFPINLNWFPLENLSLMEVKTSHLTQQMWSLDRWAELSKASYSKAPPGTNLVWKTKCAQKKWLEKNDPFENLNVIQINHKMLSTKIHMSAGNVSEFIAFLKNSKEKCLKNKKTKKENTNKLNLSKYHSEFLFFTSNLKNNH